jgi:hypothetical protein
LPSGILPVVARQTKGKGSLNRVGNSQGGAQCTFTFNEDTDRRSVFQLAQTIAQESNSTDR